MMKRLAPPPCSRSLVCGTSGSGKSVTSSWLLNAYREINPTHRILILDEKRHFFPVDSEPGKSLFPDGYTPVLHGRRNAVTVTARLLRDVDGYRYRNERVFIVQDLYKMGEALQWFYDNQDYTRPVMIYTDETLKLLKGRRAVPALLQIIQEGRGLGLGIINVAQIVRYFEPTFISESNRIYIGRLNDKADRKKLAGTTNLDNPERLLVPMRKYTFWMVDQDDPENSTKFRLAA